MKRTMKITALLMAVLMVLAMGLAACGRSSDTADDGQNPAMNFVGDYVCGRADIYIGTEGEDGMNAIVTWGSSATESSSWIMSGTFDTETLQFEYNDCVRTDYVYDEDGDAASEEEVYTGGHGVMTFTEADPITLTWQDDRENVAEGMTFEYASLTPQSNVGLANPWSTADSAEDAAEGAGVDTFQLPEGDELSLGTFEVSEYRYMTDVAEAVIDFPAAQLTIRKANVAAAADGDISGDYNEYDNEWKQDIGDFEVTCFGNREGEATKTIWSSDDGHIYSITALGLGGDTDYGLSEDDLSTIINGMQ